MRTLPLALCALLAFGCSKGPSSDTKVSSQFAEATLSLGQPADPSKPQERPGRLSCTIGLIPAYKYKDAAQLTLWVFPRSSTPGLNPNCDLADPNLHGHQARILNQAFTGEGALLHFEAEWPGGPSNQILALDVLRRGRRLDRIFATLQGQ